MSNAKVIGLFNANELFGQEKANIRVFEALRAGGIEVSVGVNAFESGGAVGCDLRARGFETFDVPFGFQWSKQFFKRQPSLFFRNLGHVARASSAFNRAFRRIQPTHIHISNPLTYSFVAPALLTKRCKLIYRMGDEPPHDSSPNLWVWRACAARASHIVANSKFVRESILRCSPSAAAKLSLIYNVAPKIACNTPAPLGSSMVMFLFAGQISEHKGIFHFIEAAIVLCREFTNVRFVVAGGSPYTVATHEKILKRIETEALSKRIELLGYTPNMGELYLAATALVVPSLFEEPAANVVLEAKSHGTPAIVYPSGGLPELVTDGITGWVCREKSTAELIHKMRAILTDRPLTRSSCEREAEQRFGLEQFETAWQNIYSRASSRV